LADKRGKVADKNEKWQIKFLSADKMLEMADKSEIASNR
jgi:hypothetical protein